MPPQSKTGARKAAAVREADPVALRLAALDKVQRDYMTATATAWEEYLAANRDQWAAYLAKINGLGDRYSTAVEAIRPACRTGTRNDAARRRAARYVHDRAFSPDHRRRARHGRDARSLPHVEP